MTAPPQPPPGWYPDPNGAAGQRYFDGNDWTEHRAVPPPSLPPKPPKKSGAGKVVLGIVAVVSFFGLLATCGHSSHSSSSSTNTSSSAVAASPVQTQSPEEIQRQQQEEQQEEAQRLDPSTYNAISPHDYAVLLKDPDAHKGEKIIVYGVVTQFDSQTGTSEFRADTAAEAQDDRFGYDQNTLIKASDPSILKDVVKDDFVQMYSRSKGPKPTSRPSALTAPCPSSPSTSSR